MIQVHICRIDKCVGANAEQTEQPKHSPTRYQPKQGFDVSLQTSHFRELYVIMLK